MRGRRSAVTLVIVGAVAIATGAVLKSDARSDERSADPFAKAGGLPPPPTPAFRPPPARLLERASTAVWAPVLVRTMARAAPDSDAVVASLVPRTPEGTSNLVLVLERRVVGGRTWLQVRLPVLPNDTTAWVPRGAVGGYHFVHTHLVVDLDRLTATLFDRGRVVFRTAVGVGTAATPTPTGEFYIRSKLTRYRSPFYGPVAFGTSARSPTLTDWPKGGYVGIHGTDEPDLLPGRVSHGCIRMTNEAILRLTRLLPVGTPLTIRGGGA